MIKLSIFKVLVKLIILNEIPLSGVNTMYSYRVAFIFLYLNQYTANV